MMKDNTNIKTNDFEDICALIVTYGNRYSYLEKTLNTLINQGISNVYVVGNGISKKYEDQIQLNFHSCNLKFWGKSENSGSAGGVAFGLKKILDETTVNVILLLDDDNYLESNGLFLYKSYFIYYKEYFKNKLFAISGHRVDRAEYNLLSKSKSALDLFPYRNSFLGFSLLNKLFGIKKLIWEPIETGNNRTSLPYTIYGGLLLSRDLIIQIGFPDESYFLYSDDHEYTYRITLKNIPIIFVPEIKISDLEKSWFLQKKNFLFDKYIKSDDKKVYFTIRNRIRFEKSNLVDNVIEYYMNMSFVYLILMFQSILHAFKNIYVINKSIIHGLSDITERY